MLLLFLPGFFLIHWIHFIIVDKGIFQYRLQITRFADLNIYKFIDRNGWSCTDAPANKKGWYHLTGVNADQNQYLYVNGILSDSVVTIRSETDRYSNEFNVMIGRCSDVNRRFFHGLLDEVRISNRARSSSWIRLCYENQRPGQQFVQIKKK